MPGRCAARRAGQPPVDLVIHRSYNPEGITSHNTVPGLLAIILSITLVMQTALSVTRETEQGTMENLLATPLRPFEVMAGKIVPNLLIGMVQLSVVLTLAATVFHVPFQGSLAAHRAGHGAVHGGLPGARLHHFDVRQQPASGDADELPVHAALDPAFGLRLSRSAACRPWARVLGEIIPATHYLRLVRGIMLKGWGPGLALPEAGVLALMLLVFAAVAVRRYQDTIA